MYTYLCVWEEQRGWGLRFKQMPSQAQALAGMQREEELGEKRPYYGGASGKFSQILGGRGPN